MALYIGTSGFSYPEWKGFFYPTELPNSEFLPHYAKVFNSVEINTTFYRAPSDETLKKWSSQVPEEFRFILKMNREVTHKQRIEPGSYEYLGFYLDRAAVLGAKLGPILFQFPPYFRADLERLQALLEQLPEYRRFVFEFRHKSWLTAQTANLLRAAGAVFCVAETDEGQISPADYGPEGAFVYLRLRAKYDEPGIERWAQYIRSQLERGRDVFCYFKHEESGTGPQYALLMQRALSRQVSGQF